MPNAMFAAGLAGLADTTINWLTGVQRAAFVRGYAFNPGHTSVADVTGAGGVLAATHNLTGRSFVDGVADAEDLLFALVPAGPALSAIVIYQASGPAGGVDVAAAAQRLVAHVDQAPGLPVTPRDLPIAVMWDNGFRRVFVL